MNPLDFIAAVVPSTGILCVAELSTKKKQHVYADKVADLGDAIKQFDAAQQDTYFALASFIEVGSRTTANALFLRSAFMDIDCGEGKPYLTKQAGAVALDAFLQETNIGALGNPWIVSSGNGLHIYWPFTENIPVTEWRVTAENLKRLCQKKGLFIDFTVTADASRVLRVPDTSNWKNRAKPRKVKILATGGTFGFAEFTASIREPLNGAALPQITPTPSQLDIPGVRPTRAIGTDTEIRMLQNNVTLFKNIEVRTQQGSGCGQLKNYLDNAAKEGMEPIWRGLLSWANKCDDGEESMLRLTAMHPYTEERMRDKLKKIGIYPCTKMDSENPGVCTSCSHWGKITNPLIFGRELVADNAEKEIVFESQVTVEEGVSQPSQIVLTRPSPPKGFSYGKNGGVYREVETEDEDKNKIKKQVLILPYDLFVVDILSAEKEHTVYMLAVRPEGTAQIVLPQRAIVSKDETVKTLAAQNIIAAFGAGNDKNLFDYVRGCVEWVSTNRKTIPIPVSCGWQPDGGFVAGGKIFSPTGTVRQIPMPGLENVVHGTRVKGTLGEWRKFPQMLVSLGMYDALALGWGVGFGSPLMEFTGLDGMTFHAGSSESGTGKSLALVLAASIWGHPRDYRVGKSTSAVAMQQRAGLLNSLPLLSDEVTPKSRANVEWFPEFIFDLAEGRGKERMESGSNKERVNTSVWSLLALLSSNTHAMDGLSGSRKHTAQAEMLRLLEWTSTEKYFPTASEKLVIRKLRNSYGIAGDIYSKWLVHNKDIALRVYEKTDAKIEALFNFTGDERYWQAGVSCSVAGSILSGPKYANILSVPIQPIIDSFRRMVDSARLIVRGNVRTAEDVLNAYIGEFYGQFINVRAVDGAMLATFGDKGVVDESVTRTQISGRVERNVTPGFTHFYIEEKMMKTFCSGMSFGYADFRKQLGALYSVEYVKKDMLSKTKGPQMRVSTIKITRPETGLIEFDSSDDPPDILSVV